MSVMFEILDRLERHEGEAAIELVAKAWSTVPDPPSIEPAPPQKPKPAVKKAARRTPKASLLDIRFDPPAPAPRKRPRHSPKPKDESPEPACDFASLWAMARLCEERSADGRKTGPARPR